VMLDSPGNSLTIALRLAGSTAPTSWWSRSGRRTLPMTRARLRIERCFAGPVYVVTTPIALTSWPFEIAYEWGALARALVVQRRC
jgi:hypothetical protein